MKNEDRQLFPASLTLRAIRDSRYNNTAYAIAELIDNSIEARASRVELLCSERSEPVSVRTRQTVSEIAVLDNGIGMDRNTLLQALKFGGGTRHHNVRGIGKYGMGLPTSSMSQCKRVDVWTWQDDSMKAWHCYIDAREIESGNDQVPYPDQDTPIPSKWLDAVRAESFDQRKGTLVVWTDLDKIQWRTGRTIIVNTSTEVGRIHRHFLNEKMVTVRMASFQEHQPKNPFHEIEVAPNDPLYLMKSTSTPEPWNAEPMFRPWLTKSYTVTVDGRQETIDVHYSIVKPEALRTASGRGNPGREPHGIHARRNIGVSVVREGREILLENAFRREGGSSTDPENRWWGCEVSFSRGCDELFGVDHNKQMATHFTQAAKLLASNDTDDNETILEEMEFVEDDIHKIVGDIRNQTRSMMREIEQMFKQLRKIQTKDSGRGPGTPESKAVQTATEADKDAIDRGAETPTDTDRARQHTSAEERQAGLEKIFIEEGQPEEDARLLAQRVVRDDLGYQFSPGQLDGYQMFNVRSEHGLLHIRLNTDHPMYDLLQQVENSSGLDESNPAFVASVAIRLLLSSWARMEDQTEVRDERARIQDIAMKWGRQADKAIRLLREKTD
jgi:hypothetical protein